MEDVPGGKVMFELRLNCLTDAPGGKIPPSGGVPELMAWVMIASITVAADTVRAPLASTPASETLATLRGGCGVTDV